MAKKSDLKKVKKTLTVLQAQNQELKRRNITLKKTLIDAKAMIKSLEIQNQTLRRSIDEKIEEKEFLLGEIDRIKKFFEDDAPVDPPCKIGDWNIVKSGGYYRAFRRVNGKVRGIHLGKNLKGAKRKIRAEETNF